MLYGGGIEKTKEWRDLIGNTPLLKLESILPEKQFNLFAKLEMFNLGGSIKDRPAFFMIEEAIKNGDINEKTTVIESSSGNMGIGLAQSCMKHNLRFIVIVDPKTTSANIRIMKAYGAVVEMVHNQDDTGSFLSLRLAKVKQLLKETPNSFWPNQYANENNARANQRTMEEIDQALDGQVDFVFCATGTCGTIRGCSDYIKRMGRATKVIAVDAKGSVIFGSKPGKRLIPGHGNAMRPALYREDMAHEVAHMGDEDCIRGCRSLIKKEVIFAGGSSGAVIMAVKKFKGTIPDGANVVVIFADRGERYLDTIYNDEWVGTHFPELTNLP